MISENFKKLTLPETGEWITSSQGKLEVPNHPIIGYIEGDGIGKDIWKASFPVFEATIHKAYGTTKSITWWELFAGEKAQQYYGREHVLPEDTLTGLKKCRVALKGPLSTPVGQGIRSLNVALRQFLDLYICLRPIQYFAGVPAPVRSPEKCDLIIFRENTEDVYMGLEWAAHATETQELIQILNRGFIHSTQRPLRLDSALGIKPMSEWGSKRLIRRAIDYAIRNKKPSVTLVHKGNIMKYTEGAFARWGYEVAEKEFPTQTLREDQIDLSQGAAALQSKVIIKDRIADAMFQQLLLRPDEYSVIAAPNLNGDYLSDAAAAQVGGLGMAPGANLGDDVAIFEATHGTAPKYTHQDKVNPGSLILSGAMMLRYIGWERAAELIEKSLAKTISQGYVTYDLHRQMQNANLVSCSGFGQRIVYELEKM
jgi:isocitrate dehydrogenase